MSRRAEISQAEERLRKRAAELDEKEASLKVIEADLMTRANELAAREEESRETKRRLNAAAEQLRDRWDRLREEKDRERDSLGLVNLDIPEAQPMSRRPSLGVTRPPLEERYSAPTINSTIRQQPSRTAYEDTPSKIPFLASAAAAPIDRPPVRSATPLRRNATKSLGNLGSQYRNSGMYEGTPARQVVPQFGIKQRTSIGSPSDVRYNEDVSMASPASSMLISPAPYVPRARRSSVAPSVVAQQSRQPSTSASAESLGSATSEEDTPILPTMIPAPTGFVYREMATPAKWGVEDPDLPSPFIRRMPTAPAQLQTTQQGIVPTRQPLGSIDIQPTASTGHVPVGIKRVPQRSRSGTLHQQVLKSNAARTSEGTGRTRVSVAR